MNKPIEEIEKEFDDKFEYTSKINVEGTYIVIDKSDQLPISKQQILDFFLKIRKEIRKDTIDEIIKKAEGIMCEVPKKTELTDDFANHIENLKYAGRFNYNKALSDLLTLIKEK